MSFQMTLCDLEWLSEIFNNMKHRVVSVRQLSLLSALWDQTLQIPNPNPISVLRESRACKTHESMRPCLLGHTALFSSMTHEAVTGRLVKHEVWVNLWVDMWTGRVVHHYETVRLQADQVGTPRSHDRRIRHRRRLIYRCSHWSWGKCASVQSSAHNST